MKLVGKTVFILGAGASRDAGAPLMFDFLDVAERLLEDGQLGPVQTDFKSVFFALAELRVAQAKARIELDNLEAALNAFEFARLLELDEVKRSEWDARCRSLSILIAATLENTVRFRRGDVGVLSSVSYSKFAKLVKVLSATTRTSILTFNYDVALDWALHTSSQIVDYCLAPSLRTDAGVELLKLHGSLNFAQCPVCKGLKFMVLSAANPNRLFKYLTSGEVLLRVSQELGSLTCCQGAVFTPSPFIVPPSLGKDRYRGLMESAWRHANRALSEAENIVVCGFSLPATDTFFRYLFANAMRGQTRTKRVRVYDPSHAVEERFRSLLGQSLMERFSFVASPFDVAVTEMLAAQQGK